MEGNREGSCSWTSFGFVVLMLVYQRVYSFYTTIPMDYQALIGFSSAAAWIAILVLDRFDRGSDGFFFVVSLALLLAAFGTQEAYVAMFAHNVENAFLFAASSVLFACGFALYCRLWLSVFQKKTLRATLVCLSGSSALSSAVACLPPIVLGLSSSGSVLAFVVRIGVVAVSFYCLRRELRLDPVANEAALRQAAPVREVWGAIKLVVVAAFAARFVQGLLVMNETGYREYGAYALLVASPLVSAAVIAFARKLGSNSGSIAAFYWVLATCSIVVLLVVAAVSDLSLIHISRAAAAAAAGAAWHVEVRNLAWHPAMEWSDGGPVRVRFLADMDEATTNANVRAQELNYGQPSMEGVNLYAYVREKTDATVTEIPVVW